MIKFYDKNFKEIPAETEDKWKQIDYSIDYEKKEVEITNREEIKTSIYLTFEQIKNLNGLRLGK